jgi:hypothetical protein
VAFVALFVAQVTAPQVHGEALAVTYAIEALCAVVLLPHAVRSVRAEWADPQQPRTFTRARLVVSYAATFVFFAALFLLTVGVAVAARPENPPPGVPHGAILVVVPLLGAVLMTLVLAALRWLASVRYRKHGRGSAPA